MNPLNRDNIPDELEMDDVMEQGEEFEDEILLGDEEDEELSSTRSGNTSNEEKNRKGRMAVMITLIVVILLVVALVAVMIGSRVKEKKEEEAIAAAEPQYTEVEFRGEMVTVEIDKETGEPIMPEFKYTETEKMQLREVGYTGDDIEQMESEQIEPAPVIEEQIDIQEQWAETFIAPYFDNASDEYKKMISNTWYGLPEVEPYDDDVYNWSRVMMTRNCDYEKLPMHGHQLFLKVYLNDDNSSWAFTTVTPERYKTLLDSGNIVMDIWYTTTSDGKTFITQMSERTVE